MAQQKSSTTISRNTRRSQIVESLSDKEYREAFVRQQIEVGLPFQIRGMRNANNISQQELGSRLKKPQSVVSRLENPGYGRFNLNTLLEVASAFNVGLLVSFVPFSTLVDRAVAYSTNDIKPASFVKDSMLNPTTGLAGTNVVSMTVHADKIACDQTVADSIICNVGSAYSTQQTRHVAQAVG